jgi:hypothetical protein
MDILAPNPKRDRQISVWVESSLHDKIRALAEKAGLSKSEVASRLLADALQRVNPQR